MDYESLPNNIYYDANIINADQSGTKPATISRYKNHTHIKLPRTL